MKLVSWNIRGLSSDTKKRSARKLVELIQESKLEMVDEFLVQRLWYDAEFKVAVVGAEGLSGVLSQSGTEIFQSGGDHK